MFTLHGYTFKKAMPSNCNWIIVDAAFAWLICDLLLITTEAVTLYCIPNLVLNQEQHSLKSKRTQYWRWREIGKRKHFSFVLLRLAAVAVMASKHNHTMHHNSHLFGWFHNNTNNRNPPKEIHLSQSSTCAHTIRIQHHTPGGVAGSHVLSPLAEAFSSLHCVPVPDELSLWTEMVTGELDSCKGSWARLELL